MDSNINFKKIYNFKTALTDLYEVQQLFIEDRNSTTIVSMVSKIIQIFMSVVNALGIRGCTFRLLERSTKQNVKTHTTTERVRALPPWSISSVAL